MKKILEESKNAKIIKDGINTSIIGKPNVGKSSILNKLIDEEKAIYWYEKASENGFSLAQYKLGLIYYYGEENGINIKKNSEYAIRLLKKAADSGVEDAKKELQKLQIK